ncbi:MAG TPA: alpha/beta fold hydrolase [Vicinamibacterales bacterium]|nr:alpha/beta fold hydrolase [Vicinamibacterales bacterium]
MRATLGITGAVLLTLTNSMSGAARLAEQAAPAREGRVAIGGASLYVRDVGTGPGVIVLHGGPDFDHAYLLPDLDRLADAYRLIYYDQRGRGKSADGVRPEDVSLASDIDDINAVRQHFQLESASLLGHSWGTVLALEYALRYPAHVSRLVLMNPAPASASDVTVLRTAYAAQLGPDMDRQREILSSAAYKGGDPEAVAARYRIHFKFALARPADYEKLMTTMRAAFISQGSEGILKARAIEDRLMADSWNVPGYDLLPRLRNLKIPTLVIAGDRDFIPIEIARHIATALPDARLVTLKGCGHFSYLECPDDLRRAIRDFMAAHP